MGGKLFIKWGEGIPKLVDFKFKWVGSPSKTLLFYLCYRCCLVYSARSVRDGTKVALKVYKRGPNYDGAVQREQYILEALQNPKNNIGR